MNVPAVSGIVSRCDAGEASAVELSTEAMRWTAADEAGRTPGYDGCADG